MERQQTLPLFEEPESSLRSRLTLGLQQLAASQRYLGTSSWKYPGWLGEIYTASRYQVRGKFSQRQFEQECLREYGEVFPIVCGDFAFYQFPSPEFWRRLFTQAGPSLRFAFKVPEEITVPIFHDHPRYGARAGTLNSSFLSAESLTAGFLEPLQPYRDRISVLLFEFPASVGKRFPRAEEFADALGTFLSRLPQDFRYAVEVRHPALLLSSYFRVLREHSIAHVFNSWSEMPGLTEQMESAEAFSTDFTVARALLRPGRKYEEAVRLFAPYTLIRDPIEEVREALRSLLWRAKNRHEPTYLFVNNRLEGFAPGTIAAVIDQLD